MLEGTPSPEEENRGENHRPPENEKGDHSEESASLSNTELPAPTTTHRWNTMEKAYRGLVTGLEEGLYASVQLLHGVQSVGIKTSSGSYWRFDFPSELFDSLQKALIAPFEKTGTLARYGVFLYEDKGGDLHELLCTFDRKRLSEIWVIDTITTMAPPQAPTVIEASVHVRELFSQVQYLLNQSPLSAHDYQIEFISVDDKEFIEIRNIPNLESLTEVTTYLKERLHPIEFHPYAEYDVPSRLLIRYHDPDVKDDVD